MEWLMILILSVATEVGVDPILAQSLAKAENPQLDAYAVSATNKDGSKDLGLLQLNNKYIDDFVKWYWDKPWKFDWRNPYDNTYVGLKHFRAFLILPDVNEWQAVIIYNCGYGAFVRKQIPARSIEHANNVITEWNLRRGRK